MRPSMDEIWMNMAELIATRSTCKRLHVGCVIVDEDKERVLAIGYNGGVKGGLNTCESDEPGNCGCFHSELNSLIKCERYKNKIIYLTDSPCCQCTKAIVNAGAKKVIFKNRYRLISHLQILIDSGIELYEFKDGQMIRMTEVPK